jgi:pSer/pThr/pTyr-binding forkhead associated (FHA) protein
VSAPEAVAAEPVAAEAAPPAAAAVLVVVRGNKLNVEYPVYEGENFIGRSDEQPVDIDLDDQESTDHIWSSRQHACVRLENGQLSVEDLNSANGTYLNRARVLPGVRQPVQCGDVIQIGAVHLKAKL